ncbi:MAG: two-component sensor histidine kinase [Arcobacter sp.]|nr:MAG: two-component sensor histidine kinase [Arcobacter sp.]
MMTNLSIKKKLVAYGFTIQLIILVILSFSLYKALEISTIDKIQTTLRVITLDIVNDILEHKNNLLTRDFHEEKEYKYEPLYIRLLRFDKDFSVIKSSKFPSSIKFNIEYLKNLENNVITFEKKEPYIISRIKIHINSEDYVLEVATNHVLVDSTLENLLYILFLIIPIMLIFSTIGGYFLVNESFAPVERILKNLKKINASDLSKRLDITNNNNDEIELLTKEINSLLTRLEISFDKISQFSSDASHELKTPLTIIRGEIEIALRKDRSIEEYKDTLESSLDEVLLIQQTIDDLLFLAKSKDNLEDIEKEIYLDEITYEAGKELERFAKIKKIDIKYDISEAQQISGHSKLLKIALKNIIKNAINFSHENSSIYLKNYSDKEYFIISVEDKGIGIPKKEQDNIFEKFYRTDKSRNKDSGGTGLGMSISKKIIDMHHSEISIESTEDIGTTIFFKFPKN